jgi:hypothetical protein
VSANNFMTKLNIALLSLVLAASSVLVTGCQPAAAADSSKGSTARTCTIQFRRDALGAAASLPIPPTTGNINGASTCVSGTFKSSSGEWVVIGQGGSETWVPKSVILLIQFQ